MEKQTYNMNNSEIESSGRTSHIQAPISASAAIYLGLQLL